MLRDHRFLLWGVFTFFVFFFALTMGASLTERQNLIFATEQCTKTGGTWTSDSYCEKTISVCTPQTL
jgi:hypothetical protein